ncbi:NAD(P)-dependent oxidoreductase [Microcella sp.]|uniref:NAD-dependent epimerase/dehydratase family protein n=1 Tax=Microcella sp. TaxID=1913979 RepID=UPI00299F7C32|nr:NAD(P)-dependent oxidoreductase [Microcella sp.]MDX2024822.1 NAD(P)-dependent oxidoreductase [Microcella sp.]
MVERPVLVTGAGGRLGQALLRLAAAGPMSIVPMAGPRASSGVRALDVADADAVQTAVGEIRPRAIIHLAALVGAACAADPERAAAVNVRGTAHIAAAAREHGAERIVFLSTAAVYGDQRPRPVTEDDPVSLAGAYATTKLEAEQLLAESGVASTSLRVFNIYGPGMRDSLVNRLLSGGDEPVALNGLDGFVRDYVHVDDVARAVLAAVESTVNGMRVLNIGSGIARSNRDLLATLPADRLAPVTIGPEVDSYSCADITRAQTELAWAPAETWPPSV